MAAPAKIDWIEAQIYYLADNTRSYKDVAQKFGVSSTAVEQRAAKEHWVELRNSLGEKTIQKVEAELVDRKAEINERHSRHYRNMQAMAGNLLLIANNTIQKKMAEKGTDNVTIYEEGLISPSRVKFLYEALKIAIDGERVTVGLPTSVERREVTGKDGDDLFQKVEPKKLYEILDRAVAGLTEGETVSGDRTADGTDEGESKE